MNKLNYLKLTGLLFSATMLYSGQGMAQTNTLLGIDAGADITTGRDNTFLGLISGGSNTTGNNNTFIGSSSGAENKSGNNNTFSGKEAGSRNRTGSYNSNFGTYSGMFNSSGSFNTNMGYYSGLRTLGSYNTNIGSYAGRESIGGNRNSYIGFQAGYRNETGDGNTFLGFQSGLTNMGSNNVFIGQSAGFYTSGSNKLCIANSTSNNLIFGDFSSDQVTINTTSLSAGRTFHVNGSAGGVSFWLFSDERFKTDIQNIQSPVEMLSQINGVSYAYKTDEFKDVNFDEGRTYGVLAQEVKAVFPELVSEGEDGYYMVNYDGLVPVLIEAIKEQQSTIDEMKEEHQTAIDELREALNNLSNNAVNETANTTNNQLEIENVVLEQNMPNPFSERSIIKYHLPESVSLASIYIYDLQGKQLKNIPIQQLGDGQIEINGNEFQPGLFTYVLVVDGQIAATKKMIITE